jgi:CubicO group peptidase (beta-lactamase class C family)
LRYSLCLLLCAAAGAASAADAAGKPDDRIAQMERGLLPAIELAGQPAKAWALAARMEHHGVPGVGIALIDGGAIAWAKGYGVLRANSGTPVTADTRFQAASLAKLGAAACALQLVKQGKLDLDTDVNATLRGWKLPANAYTEAVPVTLRELLVHRAGTTVHGFAGYAHDATLPDLRDILEGRPPANSPPVVVDIVPGSIERYSGGGYLIVQQLIEDATGESYADALRTNVLDPAGMADSTVALEPSDGGTLACGHGFGGDPVEGCGNLYPETAAAWLWTTPGDLARLAIALSSADHDGSEPLPGVHGSGETLHFDQAGWNRGFRAYLVMYPRLGKGIVVMANSDGGQELIGEIVRAAARAYGWPDFAPEQRRPIAIDPADLAARAGTYDVGEGFALTVVVEGDHLVVATPRGSRQAFYLAADGDFFSPDDGATLVFPRGADGGRQLELWGMTARRR